MIRTRTAPSPRLVFWLAALAFTASPVLAQEPAVTKRATELREAPGDTGRSLAALPAQAPVTRLNERKGPWVQVKTAAGQTGWVHLFDVGPASGAANTQVGGGSAGVSGGLRGITDLFSRSGPTATSASGIRGLDKEDIARAQPNAAAVSQIETLRQSEDQARQFAGSAPLTAVAVDPLPAPVRAGTTTPGGTNPGNREAQ